MPETGTRNDPYRNFNFKLEAPGIEGHFTGIDGMNVELESISYREGGQSQLVRKLPGKVHYGDVCLKQGVTSSREMWDWLMSGVAGKVERKNVSVVMLDTDGVSEVMRWNLSDCWVAEWTGSSLNALGQEVAIESIRLVYERLERA